MYVNCRTFFTSTVNSKSQAGRYRPTPKGDFPLTYEMAQPPHYIVQRKSWNSWNTSKLLLLQNIELGRTNCVNRKYT